MQRFRKALIMSILLLSSLACMICDEVTPGSQTEKILGCRDSQASEEMNYPREYYGAAAIKTWNVCDTRSSVNFKALDDGTCVLLVTYFPAYQNFEGLLPGDAGYGECKPTTDSLGLEIYGKFDKSEQVCKFKYCNDNALYSAGGSLQFYGSGTEADGAITCSSKESGEMQISLIPDALISTFSGDD